MSSKNKKPLPPCPDPDKYILVTTKEGRFWRRKRGTVKPAILNTVFEKNVQNSKVASPAARRIVQKLQPYLFDLSTGRLIARIAGALIKSINEKGYPDFTYLQDVDLHQPPLSRLLMSGPIVDVIANNLKLFIPIEQHTIQKRGNRVTDYYFEAILLYGDMTADNGLRIDSNVSPLYSFTNQPPTEWILSMPLPAAHYPWMVLLKASCIEDNALSGSARQFGMQVVMVGD
jgi:hypothetical protein